MTERLTVPRIKENGKLRECTWEEALNKAAEGFKSVINSEKFAKSESKLTLAIGKSTNGEIATLDLAQMPHLLIAGTTGSGKSVCMNTILASVLYQATPDEV